MIKDLPTSQSTVLLEALRVTLQTKFDQDNLSVEWNSTNPTIIEPSDNKGIGIIIINEIPKNTNRINQEEYRQREWNIGIELRASIHNSNAPYYVAHNLLEYLKDYLEVEIKRDGITGTFLGKEVRRAFSYFTVTENLATIEKRQNDFNLIQCIYRFKWRQED
jgi:hypothetical protein